MTPQRLFFVALTLALSMASAPLTVEANTAHISQNAMARDHQVQMEARYAAGYSNRAINIAGHKRMTKRKATAEQRAAQEKLNQQAVAFNAQNSEWGQAAMESLKKGLTPKTFDEYRGSKSGNTGSSGAAASNPTETESTTSTASSDDSTEQSTADDEECDGEDEENKPAATPAPAAKPTKKESDYKQHYDGSGKASSGSSGQESKPSTPKPVKNVADTVEGLLTGQGTYYDPGLGACGWNSAENERIVAISHTLFDSFGTGNPNNNPVCGKKVTISYNGKTTTAAVVDRCEGCAYGDLDFTKTGFQDLASLDVGRLSGLKWSWLGTAPQKA